MTLWALSGPSPKKKMSSGSTWMKRRSCTDCLQNWQMRGQLPEGTWRRPHNRQRELRQPETTSRPRSRGFWLPRAKKGLLLWIVLGRTPFAPGSLPGTTTTEFGRFGANPHRSHSDRQVHACPGHQHLVVGASSRDVPYTQGLRCQADLQGRAPAAQEGDPKNAQGPPQGQLESIDCSGHSRFRLRMVCRSNDCLEKQHEGGSPSPWNPAGAARESGICQDLLEGRHSSHRGEHLPVGRSWSLRPTFGAHGRHQQDPAGAMQALRHLRRLEHGNR